MNSIMTYSCIKKVCLFFPSLICRIRIRDKRWSDPDPGYPKMVGSGSGLNIPDPQHCIYMCSALNQMFLDLFFVPVFINKIKMKNNPFYHIFLLASRCNLLRHFSMQDYVFNTAYTQYRCFTPNCKSAAAPRAKTKCAK
jgi:hypothetical protein